MGSVKDLKIIKNATPDELGEAQFFFSDRYSVFDWGEMPDHIKNKGVALCLMSAYCFEKAEEHGINTHYRGLVRSDGKLVRLDEIEEPTNIMEISLARIVHPQYENGNYDYSRYTAKLANFLIPLEIIYRNGLPEGSSIFKRLEMGEVQLDELGLDHYPKPGEVLEKPVFDVSTKLEERDRYVTWRDAQKIACLTDSELQTVRDILYNADRLITQIAEKTNLVNQDGKIELAFDPARQLMLVDVIGTLDECRFTYNGFHVSKEIARQYYKKSAWYKQVKEAQKKAEEQKVRAWKSLCTLQPEKLHPELKMVIENMYTATANAFLGEEVFRSPKLEDAVKNGEEFLKSHLMLLN